MVLLTATPQVLAAIASLPSRSREEFSGLPAGSGDPIAHHTFVALSKCLSDYSLDQLLQGTAIYRPPPAPKPSPSAEYVALMTRLKAEQERKEYRALVVKQERESLQAQSNETSDCIEEKDDISPSLVLNMLLSVVMCAGVAFHLTKWWPNDGIRVLVSLGTAIVVGVAEVTVYASYLRKVEESRTIERRKKERKEFIGEYIGEDEGVDATGLTITTTGVTEKSEIWGRGINGGARRRVREKWDKEQK